MAIDLSRLSVITVRVDEITTALSDPGVASDMKEYMRLTKELADLTPKAETVRRYEGAISRMNEAREILDHEKDPDMRELASEEFEQAKAESESLEGEIKLILSPRDIRDDRSVIMEIRAGAGGEEAALFAATLVKMYSSYAVLRGFTVRTVDENKTELGGYKEIVMEIEGYGAYSRLKFESGVHRVQRVPVTESGGRIHTSTCTVAVLPEADEADVVINPSDLKIDRYRASGAGGQHINKTDSAIRITHIPTGLVVQCQDERSQIKNKDKAMAVLKSRLWEMTRSAEKEAVDSDRRSQVGTGDRSERIRTYNYHQGRVTDHRIGLTLYKLEEILAGSLDEIIDALTVAAAADGLGSGDDGEE
ncbi:MAG: peptide chain release factor 1 [Clostridiales bacterium]|nr:peptide chain release factor 1 [Clostridiales bacterium]